MRPGPREAGAPGSRLRCAFRTGPARVPRTHNFWADFGELTEHRFWADFGDFTYFRMHNLKAVNYVGGFARAGSISPEEYMGAMVDPIQAVAPP